jgi:hypothetical protein
MSEWKSYARMNGVMLLSVFGLCSLVSPVPDLYRYLTSSQPEKKDFARLLRAEDKSYSGYHHYYFTLLYRSGDEDVRFVIEVDSSLFHKKKIGDNIEVLVRSPHDIRPVRNQAERRSYAILQVSVFFAVIGGVLLLSGIRKGQNHSGTS